MGCEIDESQPDTGSPNEISVQSVPVPSGYVINPLNTELNPICQYYK